MGSNQIKSLTDATDPQDAVTYAQFNTVAARYTALVGDGTSTSIVITHGLNSRDVFVKLYEAASPYAEISADVEHTSVNTLTLIFLAAPATNSLRLVVTGGANLGAGPVNSIVPLVYGGSGFDNTTTNLGTGTLSFLALTTGVHNTSYGSDASASLTSGSRNSTFGYQAGQNSLISNDNTFIGFQAGQSYTTEWNGVTAVGSQAFQNYVDGLDGTAVGFQALMDTTSAWRVTALGCQAGMSGTADECTYLGFRAGEHCTGAYNTFTGSQSGCNEITGPITGEHNTFTGYGTGIACTTAYSCTFTGSRAGMSNADGAANTFTGMFAGSYNVSSNNNTFTGYMAGWSAEAGDNTFTGMQAGFNNIVGLMNTFTGSGAGAANLSDYNNFTGFQSGVANTSGTANTYDGFETGFWGETGSYNAYFGNMAGWSNVIGSNNCAFGSTALYLATSDYNCAFGTAIFPALTSGSGNSGFGYAAGNNLIDGIDNSLFGNATGANLYHGSNCTAVGASLVFLTDDDDQVNLGGTFTKMKFAPAATLPLWSTRLHTTGTTVAAAAIGSVIVNTYEGLLLIKSVGSVNGYALVALVAGSSPVIISQTGGWVNTAPASSELGIYDDATDWVIENGYAGSYTIEVAIV